jgi:phosphatidylglycerophosphate synthase
MEKAHSRDTYTDSTGIAYPDARINRWTVIHPAVCLSGGTAAAVLSSFSALFFIPIVMSVYAVAAFSALLAIEGRTSLRLPNLVSLLRLFGGGYALLASSLLLPAGWALFFVVAAASMSDFFDGPIARRVGTTRFGGKLDMELDAFNMFALAMAGHILFDLGWQLLLVGLIRYAYVYALLLLPPVTRIPRWIGLSAKSVCGVAVAVLVAVTAPIVGDRVRELIVNLTALSLVMSFGADLFARLYNIRMTKSGRRPLRGAAVRLPRSVPPV